jgi:hypothetical protein
MQRHEYIENVIKAHVPNNHHIWLEWPYKSWHTHIFKHVICFIHFISDCLLPTVSGTCKGFFPRFSYHQSTKSCTKFIYGGCKGNANNYLTVEECNKACVHTQPSTHSNSVCSLPTVSGTCKGYFPRFSYHESTTSCTQFIYGGCDGNANNFPTVEECNKACVHTPLSIHTNSDNSACSLPTVPGMCDAYFPRFSYHSDTNKCTQFIYGGCGGNQNNFLTENECNKSCVTY